MLTKVGGEYVTFEDNFHSDFEQMLALAQPDELIHVSIRLISGLKLNQDVGHFNSVLFSDSRAHFTPFQRCARDDSNVILL